MAIYHLHAQRLSRGKGHSAILASAYRAGVSVVDELGKKRDYSYKDESTHFGVYHEDWMPDWSKNRETLWQEVENIEKRKDAQLAFEIEFSLPYEFRHTDKLLCVDKFSLYLLDKYKSPVDVYLHDKPDNPHAHIMIPTRTVTPEGWGKKNRESFNRDDVLEIRKAWEDIANEYLKEYGQRIDCRSYKDQGIDKVPGRHFGRRLWNKVRELIFKGLHIVSKKEKLEKTEQTKKPEVEQAIKPTPQEQPKQEYRDKLLDEYIQQNKELIEKYKWDYQDLVDQWKGRGCPQQLAEATALDELRNLEREKREKEHNKKRSRDRGGYER